MVEAAAMQEPQWVIFKQNDPEWGTDILGHSTPKPGQPAMTIGGQGCLLTTVSTAGENGDSLIRTSPRTLNALARTQGGFLGGGGLAILERMAAAAGMVAPDNVRVRKRDPKVREDLNILVNTIERSLALREGAYLHPGFVDGIFSRPIERPWRKARGGFCIVNVDHTGDGIPDHFVLVVDYHPAGGYIAIDPAPGSTFHLRPDMTGDSVWGTRPGKTKADPCIPNVKHFVAYGAAPIGKGPL